MTPDAAWKLHYSGGESAAARRLLHVRRQRFDANELLRATVYRVLRHLVYATVGDFDGSSFERPAGYSFPKPPTFSLGAIQAAAVNLSRQGRRLPPGFTLIELMLVVLIIGTLATLTSPYLYEARNRAMVARATAEVRSISTEIDMYEISSPTGDAPNSLADIGWANMRDPWGRPYVYFKFPEPKKNGHPAGARKDRFLVPVNSTYDLYSLGRDGESVAAFTAAKSRDDVVRANDGGFFGLAEDF